MPSYLGGERRDHVAAHAPSRLDVIWKLSLGQGTSPAYGDPKRVWKGAGWTGQPLLIREYGEDYLIQGAFDYSLRKSAPGTVRWCGGQCSTIS